MKFKKFHNPREVPSSKLPIGRRFLTKSESNILCGRRQYESVYRKEIWCWFNSGYWDKTDWAGGLKYKTFCVPVDFKIV